MKKFSHSILSLLLAFSLVLSLSGCFDASPAPTDSDLSGSSVSSTTVGTPTDPSEAQPDSTESPTESGTEGTNAPGHNTTANSSEDNKGPGSLEIPPYSGKAYVTLNNGKPIFNSKELTTTGYENYGSLDSLGRCSVVIASLGKETMPKEGEERGSISSIKPSGWIQASYDNIPGKYLYNRCHLIGWQLSAENANKQNLITGTKYLNINGMLIFENMVADYIKETNNHVAYRVTPYFNGNNLLADGVQIEAYSVEDHGDGICFNVFCYNVQPDIHINYKDGSSYKSGGQITTEKQKLEPTIPAVPEAGEEMVWISETGKKYHSKSSCSNMKNPRQIKKSEAESMGLTPCKRCH